MTSPAWPYPSPAEETPPRPAGRRRRPWAAALFAKDRPWLNALLFVLTAATAFWMGLSWSASYLYVDRMLADPAVRLEGILADSRVVGLSVVYAVVLLAILLAHEMGHYLACRRYGLSATLPFFIPAPTLIGTLGAFIKIRSPIGRKKALFDIGIAGPLSGFVFAVPALAVGLALSKVVPALPREESIVFGEPLLLKLAGALLVENPGPGYDLVLHPVAFAGWVGILITALNLFPLGQLDGGHIAYAVLGPKAKILARVILVLFLILAVLFWAGWLVWFFLVLILGIHHPRVLDEDAPLGPGRTALLAAAVIIFILSFIPAPVKEYNVLDLIRSFG